MQPGLTFREARESPDPVLLLRGHRGAHGWAGLAHPQGEQHLRPLPLDPFTDMCFLSLTRLRVFWGSVSA